MSESAAPVTPPADAGTPPAKTETPQAPAPKADPKDAATAGLSADDRAELERLRTVHSDEKKWESRNKANLSKLRELAQSMGISRDEFNPADFDPKQAFEQLRADVEKERTERTRADIAREKGVDTRYVSGTNAEEMAAAADAYLADMQARIDAAIAKAKAPVTESTSTVKSGDRVEGPKQIASEAELKALSPAEQMKAYKDGRLDTLLGRK